MNKFRELIVNDINDAKVILVGLPYDESCSVGVGASKAPNTLRDLSKHLPPFTMDGKSIKNCKIYDYGNIESCENYHFVVEEKLKDIYSYNKFPLFIGGDHSVSIPIQKNFFNYYKKLGLEPVLIHIDAHPDICDFYDNSYYSHACTVKRAIDNGFKCENINLIGIRGFEEQEVDYFKNNPNISVYTSKMIKDEGYNKMLDEIISKYQDKKYVIYLSYDIDANDPSYAPGTGTPEAFGLNSFDLMEFIKSLFINLNIKAMDMVEISPSLDINDITSWLGLKTLYEIFEIIIKKEK